MTWYSDPMVLRDFCDAMIEAEAISEDERASVMSKPYRFTTEYAVWKASGYPADETDDGWEDFVNGISADSEDEDEEES